MLTQFTAGLVDMKWFHWLIYFITVANITGCIAIPHPTVVEELPFKNEELSFIEIGVTSRDDVRQKLGTEEVIRANGRYAIYGEPRTVAGMLVGTGYGYTGAGSVLPITTKHLLVIRYNNKGLVVDYEVLREGEKCIENGLCIEPFYESLSSSSLWFDSDLVFDDAILYANSESDKQSKQFIVSPDNCGFYLFVSGDKGHHHVISNDMAPNIINEKGYLYREANPGTIKYWVNRVNSPTSMSIYSNADEIKEVSEISEIKALPCGPGDLFFLKVTYRDKMFRDDELLISVVSEEEGKQEVLRRRLIIH